VSVSFALLQPKSKQPQPLFGTQEALTYCYVLPCLCVCVGVCISCFLPVLWRCIAFGLRFYLKNVHSAAALLAPQQPSRAAIPIARAGSSPERCAIFSRRQYTFKHIWWRSPPLASLSTHHLIKPPEGSARWLFLSYYNTSKQHCSLVGQHRSPIRPLSNTSTQYGCRY